MSTRFCRCAIIGVCVLLAMSPLSALAQYTEYVVEAPAPKSASADDLRAQLMDLIQAQAPKLNELRADEQALQAQQRPELDRLNGAVQALIESQRETRDALTSERQALRADQTAFLNLHPDASEADLAKLRAQVQALTDRQEPIREKMKSDLMALINSQKAERDALRQQRMDLRERQAPIRDQLLSARGDLETKIELATANEELNDQTAVAATSTPAIGSDGLTGLEAFAAPAKSGSTPAGPSAQTVSWPKPVPTHAPTLLDLHTLPTPPTGQ
jgi:hypothetical protein